MLVYQRVDFVFFLGNVAENQTAMSQSSQVTDHQQTEAIAINKLPGSVFIKLQGAGAFLLGKSWMPR